jgi:Cysteine sulfinate desulfinase/cysteine desulfurase and related enzymes
MIYLDNAATTQIAPEVLDAMLPYLRDEYGNAGATYQLGRRAKDAIENARAQVAQFLNCSPENIIFTSGGSESNNMVFKGLKDTLLRAGKNHIITTAIEHESVLKAAESLTKYGFYITYFHPFFNGSVNPASLESAIRKETGLVSVMCVNNETGAPNDIAEISDACKERGILFHSDCVQAGACHSVDTSAMKGLQFASISSHKIHGPKGVGALYASPFSPLSPIISGGGAQEYGMRGGTENVAGIVGFGAAAYLTYRNRRSESIAVSTLKQQFLSFLANHFGGLKEGRIFINGGTQIAPGQIVNLGIEGVSGETLMLMLDAQGICISTGSACRAHESQPSHVLTALGLMPDEARNSVRISFSKYNTREQIEFVANTMAECIKTLRQLGSEIHI